VPVPCPIDLPADLAALLERIDATPERTVLTFRVAAGYRNCDPHDAWNETTLALFRRMHASLTQQGYTVHDGLYESGSELWLYIRHTRA
jgi:hypothetical protein